MPVPDKGAAMTVDLPDDTTIVITRTVQAPRALVFAAWTEPEHLKRWLLGPDGWSMPVCEVDLRPGGAWKYGYRNDASGEEFSLQGSFVEITPPERLVTTESWGPGWPEALNTLVLTESGGKTTMTLTIGYPSKEVRDKVIATGMAGGVEVSYDRMEKYLAGEGGKGRERAG